MFGLGPEFIAMFISFTALYLVCVISPGSDFALVVRNSVLYSRRTGMYTALGTSLGLIVHATYTFIGLGFIIKQSAYGFLIIQILGACYLAYLGLTSFFAKPLTMDDVLRIEESAENNSNPQDLTPFQAVRNGFLTDVLNPFCMVFFISVFAGTLSSDLSLPAQLFFGTEIFLVAFIWFLGVAYFFSDSRIRVLFAKLGVWFGRLTGSVLLYFGLQLVLKVSP
ncbi:MAG: LysE family transporter [Alphaproteobacteria bacterium]|nr:LysE family transporter [Alphaproteobacteria bacterium]